MTLTAAPELTAVSLFAGIGGIDLALHRAGIRVVAAVEIDVAARGVLADRFPKTALFTDVREVTADDLRAAGFDPGRGVLVAGWPCQDLSLAGRRLGLGGARSGLFWEIVRILTDLRPRWFILENVPGLLSAVCSCPGLGRCEGTRRRDPETQRRIHVPCADPHPVRGGDCGRRSRRGRLVGDGRCMDLHGGAMGAVLGALAELGYGVAYRVLDAQHFGVPQRRRRVVFVGCLGDWAAPVEVLLEPEGGGGDPASGGAPGSGVAAVAALSASGGGADDNDATGGRLIAGALTTGASAGGGWRLGPDEAAGNHLVTAPIRANNHHGDQVAAESHLVAATLTSGSHATRAPGRRREDDENIVATVSAKWAKGTGGPSGDEAQNLVPVAFDLAQVTSPENRTRLLLGDPAASLAAGSQPHVAYAFRAEPGGSGNAHNTSYVADTLRSHPRPGSNSSGAMVTHALTAEGHDASEDGTGRGTPLVPMSITVGQDIAIGEDIAMPLTGSHGQPGTVAQPIAFDWKTDGSERARPNISTARTSTLGTTKQDAVALAQAVRRLTPTECERLQGFPDDWTATSNGARQADSPRYRQLGNTVAVPVFTWVTRRVVVVDARHRELGEAGVR